MILSKNQQMFGHSALEIRRLLCAGGDDVWSTQFVTATLGVRVSEADKLLDKLLGEGFIATAERSGGPWYVATMKGRALSMASARPIRRSTAKRLVADFLQRVEEVNGEPKLLLWVDEVQVFGSFLTESEMLGDVDLGVMYTRRTHDSEHFDALRKVRVREAHAAGRNFPLFIDELFWPLREIELRLRNRSGSLSLHNLCEERSFIEALPHRQIYLRCKSIPTTGADQIQ